MTAFDEDRFARIAAQIQETHHFRPDAAGKAQSAGLSSKPLDGPPSEPNAPVRLAKSCGLPEPPVAPAPASSGI